jgi:tetratricopeptide (TPR) repeat protein
MGKTKEAESFLREGMRNNPDSYELLFELGSLYLDDYHDANRARNVWELALARWDKQQSKKPDPDLFTLHKIALRLAHIEEEQGHLDRAIQLLELAQKASRNPAALQHQIDELKQRLKR